MTDPTPTPPQPKKPISILRGLAATLGAIIMALTGGCALILSTLGASMADYASAMIYVVPPFLVGLAIFLAATRLGRR